MTYDALRPWLIWPHGVLGGVVLLLGVIVLVLKKGTPTHVRLGKAFYWAMITSVVSALPLMILRRNWFLLMLSVLSLYMVVAGRREVQRHKAGDAFSPFDRVFTLATLGTCGALVAIGALGLLTGRFGGFGWAMVGIGGLGANLAWHAWKRRDGPPRHRLAWMEDHVGMMMGSFIAATTAFSSVNLPRLGGIPIPVVWLGPSVLLVPVIIWWARKIQARA